MEVTGGEPLVQSETLELLRLLCDRGYDVMLETSGAFSIEHVDPRVKIIVDVKCPDLRSFQNVFELFIFIILLYA